MYTENSSAVKIWQEDLVLYVKTKIHFGSYLAQFFLEWEMFNCRDKTHILCSITLFRKPFLFRYNVEKYLEPNGPQMTLWGMRCAWIPNATNTHSEYVKHCFSTTTIVPCLDVTSYVHCLTCLLLNLLRTVSEWTGITSRTVESLVTYNINTLYIYRISIRFSKNIRGSSPNRSCVCNPRLKCYARRCNHIYPNRNKSIKNNIQDCFLPYEK